MCQVVQKFWKTLGGLFEVFRGCHVSQLVQVFVPSLGTVKILMPCKSQPTVKIWILSLSLSSLKNANNKKDKTGLVTCYPLGFLEPSPLITVISYGETIGAQLQRLKPWRPLQASRADPRWPEISCTIFLGRKKEDMKTHKPCTNWSQTK